MSLSPLFKTDGNSRNGSLAVVVVNLWVGHPSTPLRCRIFPQFHIVFDDWFETVHVSDDTSDPPEWDVIVTKSHFESNVDAVDLESYELADEWLSKEELQAHCAQAPPSLPAHVPLPSTGSPSPPPAVSPDTTPSAPPTPDLVVPGHHRPGLLFLLLPLLPRI